MNIKSFFVAGLLVLLAACDGPRTIPPDKMERILSDALLTNGITNTSQGYYQGTRAEDDTIDFYTPILQKYGYSLDDFRHTVYAMATRKSNPLNELFGRVAQGMDSLAAIAEYRYNVSMRYDTLVMNYYADTVYVKDTTIVGSLSKYKVKLSDIKKGTYRVAFDYVTLSDYSYGTKALEYRTGRKGVKKIETPSRAWINRSVDTARFSTSINVSSNDDSLILSFYEPKQKKEQLKSLKDTSLISNVLIVYIPPIKEARKMYYDHYFDSIKLYQISRYEKDSLPVPFRR